MPLPTRIRSRGAVRATPPRRTTTCRRRLCRQGNRGNWRRSLFLKSDLSAAVSCASGKVPRQAARFSVYLTRIARRPALARKSDGVALLAENFGEDLVIGREIGDMVAARFQLPRIPPRKQYGAARCRLGVGRIAVVENDAFGCHAVESGSVHPLAAVRSEMGVGRIVGYIEQDVGRCAGANLGKCVRRDSQSL